MARARPPAHPDLPPPDQRPASRPVDAAGRCGIHELRRASGLSLWVRVERQADRDALLHRLERIDDRLEELSEERRAVVGALAALRDELYPPVPWSKGRRPPDVDTSPLPPATEGSQALTGRDLRATCLAILRRHGPLTLRELHGLLHRYGYVVGARRPVTALSDAMAYEVERRRARRVERGVYKAADPRAPRQRRARRRPPELASEPHGFWIEHRPSALDPDIDQDPYTWTVLADARARAPDGG